MNWCDWKPLIWYFWPAGGPAWHCPACGKCGVGTRSQALHTVYHEGGQLNVVDGFAGPFRDCRSTWTHYGFNPLDKVDTVRGNCRVWRAEGWSPWPWWHLK